MSPTGDRNLTALFPKPASMYRPSPRAPVRSVPGSPPKSPKRKTSMSEKTIHPVGIIMNGVTGRMGLNQHLRRSIYAIMQQGGVKLGPSEVDRKSTRLNSSHLVISYAVFCLKK